MSRNDYARHYSNTIADEVKALETLLTLDPYDDNDAQTIRETLFVLELDHLDDAADALATYLNETALEINYYRAAGDDDEEPYLRTVILRTCGGPRCEITRDSHDGQQIEVTTWDLDATYTYRVTAPNLASLLDEYAYENTRHMAGRR